ncbi:MAG: discoidin domain-containing protein, partial [Phycisphaerales bacterium]
MCTKLAYSISFPLVVGLAAGVTNARPLNQDPGPDGIVSVEAEHYDANVPQSGAQWELVGPTGGFTGEAGMQVPDLSSRDTDYAARSPRLDFAVNFVKTGTHYVWILAFGPDNGSDSCHAGLDGQEIDTCDRMSGWNGDYEWSNGTMDNAPSTFEVTTTGLHTLNIYMREDELIVDKVVLTTNPNFTLAGAEAGPPESWRGPRVTAFSPSPDDGATDVARDVVLNWESGVYADKHDIYFGTDGQAVADADTSDMTGIYRGRQGANSYAPPERLAIAETYYWRVDEVNAPPDNTIRKGDVWSFTAELFAYAVGNVAATASSQAEDQGPENAADGSGLTDDLHSNETEDMWISSTDDPGPVWIEYELDKVYKLHEMWVWNYNGESILSGFGLRNVTIEYSADGTHYTKLGDTHEFAQGTGMDDYAHNPPVNFDGAAAQYVRITANSNWGGAIFNQYGLSEVRFFYIPLRAREPNPGSDATDVDLDVTLGWIAGREAAEHNVYFSTSWKAVVNGTAPMETVTETSYGPLALDFGERYFWRVDEVNDLETPTMLEGDVWSFMTREFLVVDDFERYDTSTPIWEYWRDGLGFIDLQGVSHPGNGTGSEVGDATTASYTEESIVHEGNQSMPYLYDNNKPDKAKYSEAQMKLSSSRDWTRDGIKALTLWFRGNPAAFVEAPAGTYTMSASGRDIFDEADEFRYAWKRLSGAGSIVAQVLSVENTDDWAKAGVMIRETLDADSRFAAVYITPTKTDGTAENGCRFQMRALTGGSATSDTSVATDEQKAIVAPYWVKLERTATGEFNAYYSSDPATDPWHLMVWSPRLIQMTDNVYIGLALTSHNSDAVCKAEFSDIQTTGAVTPAQWTQQAIGATMISNDPEPMYVAIANNTGTPAVVYHDDPNAALTEAWTEWSIDLKDFADQGVDLTDVNSVAI